MSLNSIQPHFFHSKNFQIDFLSQTSLEWVRCVGIMLVALISRCVGGVCTRVCVWVGVYVITMLAFFLCLKQPFMGIIYKPSHHLAVPRDSWGPRCTHPAHFVPPENNNSSNRSVLSTGLWDESRNFLTHCITSELQCQVHRGESRYRNLVHRPQLLKTDFWWPENNVSPKYSLLQNYLKELG